MRRKALQMAGIGILLFGMVCSGCDRKAQVNAEPESSEKIEYAVTETEEVSTETKKLVIEDLMMHTKHCWIPAAKNLSGIIGLTKVS